jgi:hypothetical protein
MMWVELLQPPITAPHTRYVKAIGIATETGLILTESQFELQFKKLLYSELLGTDCHVNEEFTTSPMAFK